MARPFLDESQMEAQRARLVRAALDLYRERGYDAVTLRNVGAKLDISHAALYRYFPSKEELVAAARTEVWSHLAEHLERRDPRSAAPIVRLRDLCLAVVEFGARKPSDYRLIFSLSQPSTEEHPALELARGRAVNFVVSACQRAIDAGDLQGDALDWGHVAWASIHGVLSLHVANLLVLGRDLVELVRPVVQVLLPNAPKIDWNAFRKRLSEPEHANRDRRRLRKQTG